MDIIWKAIAVGVTLSCTAVPRADGQSSAPTDRRYFGVVGLAAAGYLSSHPEGGPVGVGVNAGIMRQTGLQTEMRILMTVLDTWATADNIALCHPLPDGSCLPDSVFPDRLWSLELYGALRPFVTAPVWVLAGGGIVAPQGAQPGQGGGDVPGARAGTRGTWRVGIEGALGRALNAPRVQLTRTGYSRAMLSLSGLVALSIVFPLAP